MRLVWNVLGQPHRSYPQKRMSLPRLPVFYYLVDGGLHARDRDIRWNLVHPRALSRRSVAGNGDVLHGFDMSIRESPVRLIRMGLEVAFRIHAVDRVAVPSGVTVRAAVGIVEPALQQHHVIGCPGKSRELDPFAHIVIGDVEDVAVVGIAAFDAEEVLFAAFDRLVALLIVGAGEDLGVLDVGLYGGTPRIARIRV